MWNKYIKKLSIHKLAHHLTGCYTVSTPAKGMTRAFIKIFRDEKNEDSYEIVPLRYCQIRNCFAYDVHKNKFIPFKNWQQFTNINPPQDIP